MEINDLTADEKKYIDMPHPITIKLYEDEYEKYYVAQIPLLPGCMSHGYSVKEAIDNVMDAKISWVSAQLEFGGNIKTPENEKPLIELLGSYTEEEIQEMNDVYQEMSDLIVAFKKKNDKLVFLHDLKKK